MNKADAAAKAMLAMQYVKEAADRAALAAGDVNGDGRLTVADIEAAHAKAEANAALFTQKATPLGAIAATAASGLVLGWFAHAGWVWLLARWAAW